MTSSFLEFSVPTPFRDSVRGPNAWRADATEAVLVAFFALVLYPVRGLLQWADRTLLRTTLDRVRAVWPAPARRCAVQAKHAWTITPVRGTDPLRDAAIQMLGPRPTTHFLHLQHALPVESPGRGSVLESDETRDSDQREPARDAGRHHRGRPAR